MSSSESEVLSEHLIVSSDQIGQPQKPIIGLSALAMRLTRHYHIEQEELDLLEATPAKEVAFKPRTDILARGSEMNTVMMLVSGWAIRCRYTPEGARQILHILLPGDLVTPSALVIERSDHSITSLTDTVVRFVSPQELSRVFCESKQLAAAFWWASEQEYGVLREQIVRLGRRSALARVSHLLLELHRRLVLVGLAGEGQFLLPLSQVDMADVLGLSNVHIYRTLKKLINEGYITHSSSLIQLLNPTELAKICDFDLKHLHLDSTILTAIEKGNG